MLLDLCLWYSTLSAEGPTQPTDLTTDVTDIPTDWTTEAAPTTAPTNTTPPHSDECYDLRGIWTSTSEDSTAILVIVTHDDSSPFVKFEGFYQQETYEGFYPLEGWTGKSFPTTVVYTVMFGTGTTGSAWSGSHTYRPLYQLPPYRHCLHTGSSQWIIILLILSQGPHFILQEMWANISLLFHFNIYI